MNRAETSRLLALIRCYDNRKADDAAVLAWHAVLGDLDLADCEEAVIKHMGTSDAWLMPVHIRRIVDELRRERAGRYREERLALMASQVPAGAPPTRDRSDAIEALIAELRAKLPKGHPDSLRHASGYWREAREARQRQKRAVPNPHYDPAALARLAEADPTRKSTSEDPPPPGLFTDPPAHTSASAAAPARTHTPEDPQ